MSALYFVIQGSTNFDLQGHLNNINVTVMQFSNGSDYRLVVVYPAGKRKNSSKVILKFSTAGYNFICALLLS